MRAKLFFAFVVLLFFAVQIPAFAVSVSIISSPPTINQDPFTITASVSGASAGTNYLRIDIFKEGTSNYFGETYNGSSWYGGSSYTQYLPITIQSGTPWSGDVMGKAGSPAISDYDGQGSYKIRLRRYTESGGTNATEANGSIVSISLSIPTPTLTLLPPTSTPKPTATNTPVPTATPIKSQSSNITLKPTPKVISKESAQVLGDKTDDLTPTPTQTVEVLGDSQSPSKSDSNFIPKIFISIGIVFLILCGIVVFYPLIKNLKKNTNE